MKFALSSLFCVLFLGVCAPAFAQEVTVAQDAVRYEVQTGEKKEGVLTFTNTAFGLHAFTLEKKVEYLGAGEQGKLHLFKAPFSPTIAPDFLFVPADLMVIGPLDEVKLPYGFHIPEDIPLGYYHATLKFTPVEEEERELIPAFSLDWTIEVQGKKRLEVTVKDVQLDGVSLLTTPPVLPVEPFPHTFTITLQHTGNVPLIPEGDIVLTQSGAVLTGIGTRFTYDKGLKTFLRAEQDGLGINPERLPLFPGEERTYTVVFRRGLSDERSFAEMTDMRLSLRAMDTELFTRSFQFTFTQEKSSTSSFSLLPLLTRWAQNYPTYVTMEALSYYATQVKGMLLQLKAPKTVELIELEEPKLLQFPPVKELF